MLRKFLLVTICLAFGAALACTSTETTNSNADNSNLPPGFSTNAIEPSGDSTPGIPAANSMDSNTVPKGTTPTPGIPAPEDMGKPMKKGTTPTPGIPSQEELKKMANTPRTLEEVNNPNSLANSQKSQGEPASNSRKKPKPPQ